MTRAVYRCGGDTWCERCKTPVPTDDIFKQWADFPMTLSQAISIQHRQKRYRKLRRSIRIHHIYAVCPKCKARIIAIDCISDSCNIT